MGRIDRLAERYKSTIALPWQKDLAGAQRIVFIVYDKVDERRVRARKDLFALATAEAEQPAAWVSGFFGSGKSHMAKMLRFLWTDYIFPDDGASARGLARLPNDVQDVEGNLDPR